MQSTLFSGSSKTKQNPYETYSSNFAHYTTVTTPDQLRQLVSHLHNQDEFAYDTETSSVNSINTDLVGISFSTGIGVAWYVPTNSMGLTQTEIVKALKPIFENAAIRKIAHNHKFDYQVLRGVGIDVQGKIFDTMVAAYLIDNTQKVKMDVLSKKYLGYEPISIDTFLKDGLTMFDFAPEEVSTYACEDADVTFRLYEHFKQKLEDDGMTYLAERIEFPTTPVLAKMELNGVDLDVEFLKEFQATIEADLEKIEAKMYEAAGYEFNLNSWQQLGVLLYDNLKYPVIETTKTGGRATGEDVLEKLKKMPDRGGNNVPEMILEYRKLAKLNNTYIKGLPPQIEPSTGKLHTSFNQTITTTGRLSSSNPNLQNIPNRDELGRKVRRAFVASDGYTLLSADYSQMELRIIASICKDENMIGIFERDEDIHTATAAQINGVALDKVTGKQRYDAKTVNYLIPYGGGAYKLSKELGSSESKAQKLLDSWFNQFPRVFDYIEGQKEFARANGYVKTMFGRRRYLPDINHNNKYKRFEAERQAVNMPIQGASADIMKLALVQLDEWIRESHIDARLLLQVHDEVVMEAAIPKAHEIGKEVIRIMQTAADIGVVLKVDYGLGKDWSTGH